MKRAAAIEEHQFVSRFNHLIRVLIEFSDHYNKDHSVNIKKIKAVKKAWHDLEKTDSWFRLDERESSDPGFFQKKKPRVFFKNFDEPAYPSTLTAGVEMSTKPSFFICPAGGFVSGRGSALSRLSRRLL